jgi:large subunit ribosomal protein L17
MRHLKKGRELSRGTAHRLSMLRNLVTALFEHGKIETTEARAKELRGVADRMITLGKQNTLHAKRLAARVVRTRQALSRLFDEIAPGFAERQGGYTRLIKTAPRHGDCASMSVIELMPAGAPPVRAGKGPSAPRLAAAVVPQSKEKFSNG